MFKVLTFTKQTGAGTQSVTGVGFQARALLLFSTRQTGSGATDGVQLTLSMTDGVRQATRFIRHPDNETSTTSAQSERTNRVVYQTAAAASGGPPAVQNEATFVSFTADGFVLDWLTNDGVADVYHAILFGGDVEVAYAPVKIDVANGGTIDVTGLGFEPESFIVMGGVTGQFGAGDYNLPAPYGSIHGFGFSNASVNGCSWTLGFGTAGAATAYRGQHTDRCASIRVANITGLRDTDLCGIAITDATADGFEITRVAGGLTHQPVQHILAIRGVRSAIGSFDTPASVDSETLALGFQPELIVLQSINSNAAAANGMHLAMGAWEPTASAAAWIGGTHGASPSVYARANVTGKVLEARAEDATGASSSVVIDATVSNVTATGADIDFAVVPGTPAQVLYIAFGASGAAIDGGCRGGGAIAVIADPPGGETFTGRVIEPRAWLTLGFDDQDRHFSLDTYNHVPSYYGGRKVGNVLSFGAIRRSLPYPRGGYQMADAVVEIDDTGRLFAALEDDPSTQQWWNRQAQIYLASKETIESGGTPHTLFRGVWRGHRTSGLEKRSLEFTDLFGSQFSLFNLEQTIPQRLITAEDFPDAPPDVLGRVVPIVYGNWTSDVRSGAIEMTLGGVPGGYYPFGVGLQGPEVGYVATVGGNGRELNTLVAAATRSWDELPGTTPTNVVVTSGGAGTLPQTRNNTWTVMVTAVHDGVESDPAPVAGIALGSDSAINVSWTGASGGANGGYRLYVTDNPFGVSTKFSAYAAAFFVGSTHVYTYSVGSGTTSLAITAPGTSYTYERVHLYQVSAVFVDGTESAPGGLVIGLTHPYARPLRLRWLPFGGGSPSADVAHYVVRRAPYTGVAGTPAFDRQFTVATDATETVDGVVQVVWSDTFDDGDAAVVGQVTPPAGGPIPVIYVGTSTRNGATWGRLLVAGHAVTHYEGVYIGGVPAPTEVYGISLLVPGYSGSPDEETYEDINGHRYACIYAKDAVLAAHLDGTAPITLSLCAAEDVGDGSGRTITRAPRVIAHLLEQWAVPRNGMTYQTGGWSTPASGDDGVPWLNTVSFDALEDIEIARLAAYRTAVGEDPESADDEGYELNLYIAEPLTVRQLVERLTVDTDIYFGQNAYGQLVGIHPPDAYDPDAVVHLTDVVDIVESMPTEQVLDDMEVTRVYDYGFHPASNSFVHTDEAVRNSTALANNLSKDLSGERVALRGVQKQAQARDLARRAVTRNGRPPRRCTITATLHALQVNLGDVITVDAADGTGAEGWVERPLWVLDVSVQVADLASAPVVVLKCLDAVWLTAAAPTLTLVTVPAPKGTGGGAGGSSPSASWSGTIGEIESGLTELTGDVTAGPGSGAQAATIAAGAVTYAKMQAVSAASRLLGRGASGGSSVREIDLGSNLAWDGDTINATGGGAGTSDNAIASPPSSPADGDLWLPPDAPVLLRYDGVTSPPAWIPYGPVHRLVDPIAYGPSTWVNQGTSSVATSNRLIALTAQRSGSTATVAIRALVKSAPAGNFTLIVGMFALVAPVANYSEAGILLRNSTSGRLETVGMNYATAGSAYVCQNYLSPTSYAATPGALGSPFAHLTWFRITYNSGAASCTLAYSYDKHTWHTLFSGSSYTLGADQVGFYVNGQQNTMDPFASIVSWEES